MQQQVRRPFNIRAKAKFSGVWVFVEEGREMNDCVIARNASHIDGIENVEVCPTSKIVGIKKPAHVNAEIAAAARN